MPLLLGITWLNHVCVPVVDVCSFGHTLTGSSILEVFKCFLNVQDAICFFFLGAGASFCFSADSLVLVLEFAIWVGKSTLELVHRNFTE